MGYKSAIIVVEEIKRSRELYENVLEMIVAEDYGIYNVGFEGGLSLYQKAFFEQLTDGLQVTSKANNCVLYFEVDDPRSLDNKISQLGYAFINHVREQPWGQLSMRFYDADGYILEIGEKMDLMVKRLKAEGKTIQEISAKTSLTIEQIEGYLK